MAKPAGCKWVLHRPGLFVWVFILGAWGLFFFKILVGARCHPRASGDLCYRYKVSNRGSRFRGNDHSGTTARPIREVSRDAPHGTLWPAARNRRYHSSRVSWISEPAAASRTRSGRVVPSTTWILAGWRVIQATAMPVAVTP
jgi:hypothetical protein